MSFKIIARKENKRLCAPRPHFRSGTILSLGKIHPVIRIWHTNFLAKLIIALHRMALQCMKIFFNYIFFLIVVFDFALCPQ